MSLYCPWSISESIDCIDFVTEIGTDHVRTFVLYNAPRAVRIAAVNTLKAQKVRENRAVRKDWRALIRRRNWQGQVSMGGKYTEGRHGYK